MVLDVLGSQGLSKETVGSSILGVNVGKQLLETEFLELLADHPGSRLVVLPEHLILVGALELAAATNTVQALLDAVHYLDFVHLLGVHGAPLCAINRLQVLA
ncbi:hypothetical protein ATCV1_z680R [Acanthocystis turfacea chlorella virus 1]|uniref:Uncharacterized protein z680R n=1 Tax=Chlorovirus heliozoae TaxID=322019 RepID=A7K9U0_9PHYC|nr:hypothetical protein ATCV1_z680R [Acanthocystis turfacea chlorella virus 1]ABT16814.1 hypothetical protein ATCV1_z680R [Acanthocystis turfacea chlorella virus 1]